MTVSSSDFGLKNPTYLQTNASGLVKSGIGRLRGIMVTYVKDGSIELMDNIINANPVLVREFAVEPRYYDFGDVTFGTGLYMILGGLVACTVYYF